MCFVSQMIKADYWSRTQVIQGGAMHHLVLYPILIFSCVNSCPCHIHCASRPYLYAVSGHLRLAQPVAWLDSHCHIGRYNCVGVAMRKVILVNSSPLLIYSLFLSISFFVQNYVFFGVNYPFIFFNKITRYFLPFFVFPLSGL